MAELTPAQECAVRNCKYEIYDRVMDLMQNGSPIYSDKFADIISRYIREAEQRGREEAAGEVALLRGERDRYHAGLTAAIRNAKDMIAKSDPTNHQAAVHIAIHACEAALSTPEAPHD